MKNEKQNYRSFYKNLLITGMVTIAVLVTFGFTRSTNHHQVKNTVQQKPAAPAKQWVKVYSFSGVTDKTSPSFDLKGKGYNARMIYKYNNNGSEGGSMAIYLMDDGTDLDKDGGFPMINTEVSPITDTTALQKAAGKYYLVVRANGTWNVSIEEMQ